MDLRVGTATLAIALATGAWSAGAGPPTVGAADIAGAAYRSGAWHYEGVLDTMPTARFLVSLSGRGQGGIVGEALLLTPDRRLLAASAVTGRVDDGGCHLSLELNGDQVRLDGTCRPDLLAGELTRSPPRPDLLTRLVAWWDDRAVHGEAWLAAGGSV